MNHLLFDCIITHQAFFKLEVSAKIDEKIVFINQESIVMKKIHIWFPPDLPHCPVRFARINKPILWFTIGIGMKGGEYSFSKPPADKID